MLKALDWLQTNSDAVQALGTALAYGLAIKSGIGIGARWYQRKRQLETFVDHLQGPTWAVTLRYIPPKRLRLYARISPIDRSATALLISTSPGETWLRGVPGKPPPVSREMFKPHHVPLLPVETDSPVVGCEALVFDSSVKIWRIRVEVRDHDTDKLLMACKIAPSRHTWAKAGNMTTSNTNQD